VLVLTFKVGETWTFKLPDGTQAHAYVSAISAGSVRIGFIMPDALRVTRDTTGAVRAFEDFKR